MRGREVTYKWLGFVGCLLAGLQQRLPTLKVLG